MKRLLLLAAALAASMTSASAIPLTYVLDGGDVVVNESDPGLVIETKVADIAGASFTLNDGDSYTFSFFKIWTDENSVGNDDMVAKLITATLDFLIPDVDATQSGTTVGWKSITGFYQEGKLTWTSGPVVISLLDRVFSIELSDAVFNSGDWWSLDEGRKYGATVTATVTQISSSVPDGGMTVALLGLGIVGLVGLRRKLT